ncbi:restriction endonuclease subunit S [Methanosarcina acetivorans]|uniref:restriction endonuclease subunit S n=1 Tax=Methanosarcina acetivorans TaxID=2214 RepID=UPI001D0511C5|nr:restriction endonuclease subunit S [Methanosarcina acetivorans]
MSDAKKLDNVEVKKNDILFNITGNSICRCCIVPGSILPARVNQHVSIIRTNIRTNTKLYYKFLYCYLCLKRTKEALLSFDADGTRKAITKGNLEKLVLPLPSYTEQTQIGDFIGLVNDKIDLNNQMNSTLEQIAQTLFKRWFIDFEFPDENGNPYKSREGKEYRMTVLINC